MNILTKWHITIISVCFFISPAISCFGQVEFLSSNKQIEFFKSDKSFSNEYNKLMEDLLKNKYNQKKKEKTESKLVAFFENYINSNKYNTIMTLAKYQLGHYYAFGEFDPYFYAFRPSDMNRESLKPLNKQLALSYLDKVPVQQGMLRLIPNTWLTNYEKGLGMASPDLDEKEILQLLTYHKDINFNLFNCAKFATDYCDCCDQYHNASFDAIVNFLEVLYDLPQDSPMKSQLLQELSTTDIIELAFSFKKAGKKYETLFYGLLAATRGDVNSLAMVLNEISDVTLKHYELNHKAFFRVGYPYEVLYLRFWLLEEKIKQLNESQKDLCEKIRDYYSELGDELFENYKAEQKARKIARRKEKWRNIGLAFAQAIAQVGSQYAAQQNNVQQINSVGVGNLNSLLDPRLAAMQVNNQYYNEYTQFCMYNKKPDGSSYTFDEWLTMRAQAVQNLNNDTEATDRNEKEPRTKIVSNHQCSLCHGTGRIGKEMNTPQFGLGDTSKEKCNECGEWFPKSWGHTHVTCPNCHGKGTF